MSSHKKDKEVSDTKKQLQNKKPKKVHSDHTTFVPQLAKPVSTHKPIKKKSKETPSHKGHLFHKKEKFHKKSASKQIVKKKIFEHEYPKAENQKHPVRMDKEVLLPTLHKVHINTHKTSSLVSGEAIIKHKDLGVENDVLVHVHKQNKKVANLNNKQQIDNLKELPKVVTMEKNLKEGGHSTHKKEMVSVEKTKKETVIKSLPKPKKKIALPKQKRKKLLPDHTKTQPKTEVQKDNKDSRSISEKLEAALLIPQKKESRLTLIPQKNKNIAKKQDKKKAPTNLKHGTQTPDKKILEKSAEKDTLPPKKNRAKNSGFFASLFKNFTSKKQSSQKNHTEGKIEEVSKPKPSSTHTYKDLKTKHKKEVQAPVKKEIEKEKKEKTIEERKKTTKEEKKGGVSNKEKTSQVNHNHHKQKDFSKKEKVIVEKPTPKKHTPTKNEQNHPGKHSTEKKEKKIREQKSRENTSGVFTPTKEQKDVFIASLLQKKAEREERIRKEKAEKEKLSQPIPAQKKVKVEKKTVDTTKKQGVFVPNQKKEEVNKKTEQPKEESKKEKAPLHTIINKKKHEENKEQRPTSHIITKDKGFEKETKTKQGKDTRKPEKIKANKTHQDKEGGFVQKKSKHKKLSQILKHPKPQIILPKEIELDPEDTVTKEVQQKEKEVVGTAPKKIKAANKKRENKDPGEKSSKRWSMLLPLFGSFGKKREDKKTQEGGPVDEKKKVENTDKIEEQKPQEPAVIIDDVIAQKLNQFVSMPKEAVQFEKEKNKKK